MPFIRFRKLKYDDSGKIISGTAAIIDVKYIPGKKKNSSKQSVREKLGKVIEKYSNKKGLFVSPTRGLIIYDSSTDSFSTQLSKSDVKDNVSNISSLGKPMIFFNDPLYDLTTGNSSSF